MKKYPTQVYKQVRMTKRSWASTFSFHSYPNLLDPKHSQWNMGFIVTWIYSILQGPSSSHWERWNLGFPSLPIPEYFWLDYGDYLCANEEGKGKITFLSFLSMSQSLHFRDLCLAKCLWAASICNVQRSSAWRPRSPTWRPRSPTWLSTFWSVLSPPTGPTYQALSPDNGFIDSLTHP